MKKHVTDCKEQFEHWFPELKKCPVCKNGHGLFQNFRVKSIIITVEDFDRKPVQFKFTNNPNTNPLADYRS